MLGITSTDTVDFTNIMEGGDILGFSYKDRYTRELCGDSVTTPGCSWVEQPNDQYRMT